LNHPHVTTNLYILQHAGRRAQGWPSLKKTPPKNKQLTSVELQLTSKNKQITRVELQLTSVELQLTSVE